MWICLLVKLLKWKVNSYTLVSANILLSDWTRHEIWPSEIRFPPILRTQVIFGLQCVPNVWPKYHVNFMCIMFICMDVSQVIGVLREAACFTSVYLHGWPREGLTNRTLARFSFLFCYANVDLGTIRQNHFYNVILCWVQIPKGLILYFLWILSFILCLPKPSAVAYWESYNRHHLVN